MESQANSARRRQWWLAEILFAIAALATLAYSAFLLVVGVEVNVSELDQAAQPGRERLWSAVIPLGASILALIGIARAHRGLVLGSSLTVLIFGVLFVFSTGFYFAALGLAMTALAILVNRRLKPASEEATHDISSGPGGQ